MKATIKNLDKRTTKNGNPFYTILFDNDTKINDFDSKRCELYASDEIKVGDEVEYDTVQNGQWSNLSHLEKVSKD